MTGVKNWYKVDSIEIAHLCVKSRFMAGCATGILVWVWPMQSRSGIKSAADQTPLVPIAHPPNPPTAPPISIPTLMLIPPPLPTPPIHIPALLWCIPVPFLFLAADFRPLSILLSPFLCDVFSLQPGCRLFVQPPPSSAIRLASEHPLQRTCRHLSNL